MRDLIATVNFMEPTLVMPTVYQDEGILATGQCSSVFSVAAAVYMTVYWKQILGCFFKQFRFSSFVCVWVVF